VLDLDRVRIDERSLARQDIDIVLVEVGHDLEPVVAHEPVLVREEILQRRAFLHLEVDGVQLAGAKARQIQRRLAQRLERDARTGHRTAQGRSSFDQGHPLAEVGGLGRALLPGRTTADHDQVVLCDAHRAPLTAACRSNADQCSGPRSAPPERLLVSRATSARTRPVSLRLWS
jgi:hypothetical protein